MSTLRMNVGVVGLALLLAVWGQSEVFAWTSPCEPGTYARVRPWYGNEYVYVQPNRLRLRVYYSPPAFRYRPYAYPRTPNMLYYGPMWRVRYGRTVYAY